MEESIMSIGNEYLTIVMDRFKSVKGLGDKTIHQLSEDEIYWTYHTESNSVAIIVKHMSGNMVSRWTDFLTTDGEKDDRDRDDEFVDDIPSKSELRSEERRVGQEGRPRRGRDRPGGPGYARR